MVEIARTPLLAAGAASAAAWALRRTAAARQIFRGMGKLLLDEEGISCPFP
jgi:hypothetical protein